MAELTHSERSAPKFAVSNLNAQDVLGKYLEGQTTPEIAKELGISRQALNAWLRRQDLEGWHNAQHVLAEEEVEKAKAHRAEIQQSLKGADRDEVARLNVALACARDAEKSAQWRLERLVSRLYGQKQEVNLNVSTDLGERLRRAKGRVIEDETVVEAQQVETKDTETSVVK